MFSNINMREQCAYLTRNKNDVMMIAMHILRASNQINTQFTSMQISRISYKIIKLISHVISFGKIPNIQIIEVLTD